ncbi:MAG TPA: OB-fold domain-containing protein, partial [Promineifilum sp.]|nr:OB-fold domain-containing protein [Promineifilum sp.]
PIDPHTHSDEMEWVELSGRGTLAAFTSVYIGTSAMIDAGYDRARPYVAAIVELAEGPRISAQLLGVDGKQPDIAWIGRPMQASFIERGEGEKRRAELAFEMGARGITETALRGLRGLPGIRKIARL